MTMTTKKLITIISAVAAMRELGNWTNIPHIECGFFLAGEWANGAYFRGEQPKLPVVEAAIHDALACDFLQYVILNGERAPRLASTDDGARFLCKNLLKHKEAIALGHRAALAAGGRGLNELWDMAAGVAENAAKPNPAEI